MSDELAGLSNEELLELIAIEEQLEEDAAKRNLLDFILYVMPEYEVSWHHKIICDVLTDLADKTDQRLIIQLPPRHGKSEIISRKWPAWLLGRDPDHQVMLISYNDDLASGFCLDVQRTLETTAYTKLFPATTLVRKPGGGTVFKKTSNYFEVVGQKGRMLATGVGGSVTGKGANCFVAGTRVHCRSGVKEIQDVAIGEYVLTLNHATGVMEWRRVQAVREKESYETVTITTQEGRQVRCTPDHRIFTGDGYKSAIDCNKGERIITIGGASNLQLLQEGAHTTKVRGTKEAQTNACGLLLLKRLFKVSSRNKEQKTMQSMRRTNPKKNTKILCPVQEKPQLEKPQTYHLPRMQGIISTQDSRIKNMLSKMRRYSPLSQNAQQWKPAIQRQRAIQGSIFQVEAFDHRERWWSLCCMRKDRAVSDSSHKRGQALKLSFKSNNPLQNMSSNAPQIGSDAISSITRNSPEKHKVYDLQVEGNHNFFAEGILVHNCLILDDLYKNREEAESPAYRERVYSFFTSTAYTRLEKGANIVMLMTRWHDDDLIGKMLKKASEDPSADQWEVISLPAICEDTDKWEKDPRKDGEALWPNKYTARRLQSIRATIGERDWSSLFQQKPRVAGGNIFKRDWFKYWTPASLPPRFEHVIASWDCSFKDTKNSDFVCGTIWGLKGSSMYLLDRYHGRANIITTVQVMNEKLKQYPDTMDVLIEDKANGSGIIDLIKNKVSGIIPVNPKDSKEARAHAVAYLVEAGNVYLPEAAPWVGHYLNELCGFPKADHDDQVDSTTMALARLGKMTRGGDISVVLNDSLGGLASVAGDDIDLDYD